MTRTKRKSRHHSGASSDECDEYDSKEMNSKKHRKGWYSSEKSEEKSRKRRYSRNHEKDRNEFTESEDEYIQKDKGYSKSHKKKRDPDVHGSQHFSTQKNSRNKYSDDNLPESRKSKTHKNLDSEKEISKLLKESRECQRYGKWYDESEKKKSKKSSEEEKSRRRTDKGRADEDADESYNDKYRRNLTPDKYENRDRIYNYKSRRDLTPDKYDSCNNRSPKLHKRHYENERDFQDRRKMHSPKNRRDFIGRRPESSRKYNEQNIVSDKSDASRTEQRETFSDKDDICKMPDKQDVELVKVDEEEPLSKRVKIGNINMRTGGAYIPPARLRMMQEKIKDKGSEEYQRIAWEALKKSIVGMTNKVNISNIAEIVPELFKENIIRGRGILARAIMQAQAASPTFTRVYAALVAIINTKFPEIGELILKRLIIQYKRGFRRNDKTVCMTAARFLAHLLNQEVAHEVLILEMVTHLLENPTEDSVEVAIATLKECGKKLTQLTARGMRAITQRVRDVLHEGNVDVRVRYMIEVFFAVQKDDFKDFEVIPKELDLVQEEDKYTHLINLDDAIDGQDILNVFKFDSEYVENEEKYKSVAKEILGDSSDEEGSDAESGSEDDNEDEEAKTEENQQILDMTETNIVCLRRKIYLTIQSSLDFEECAHKLLKLELKPGQILEMCYMILDCCAQQRTYEKIFGLLAQRFCQLNKVYVEPFTEIFENSYKTIHRLETNKLRNVAKFFAHLLYTDAISWMVLSIIKLNEEDTTSSSRIFIKILFQELCEYLGLTKLNERVKDMTLQEAFDGLFPRDHPHNTRFAINFFTSIGLGGLTDELREHLKNLPKNPLPIAQNAALPEKESAESSSSSSSSSSSPSTSSSDSESDERSTSKVKQKRKKK